MELDLWTSFQNLNLGADQSPMKISTEAQKNREANHRLSLIVQGLNPARQPPADIKNTLPKAWKLDGRITSRSNDDGTVQFFFRAEHQLLTVLEKGPWSFREWMLVVDRWTRRHSPDYLQTITFWVKVLHIPDDSRDERTIREVGSGLGIIGEVFIQQPFGDHEGEVWIRVKMNAYERLTFVRYVDFEAHEAPILVRFSYDKLRKLCLRCGALTHYVDECDHPMHEPVFPNSPDPENEMQQGGVNSSLLASEGLNHAAHNDQLEQQDDLMGENVSSNINMDLSGNLIATRSNDDFIALRPPEDVPLNDQQPITIPDVGNTSVASVRGLKRKAKIGLFEEETSTNQHKTQPTNNDEEKGEVATPKPPADP
ncbi:hypothetical protein AALP_AAs51720U000700 [Arabis alpina]|uniref:DUF4283 domain-containing protein n=1 Tax=Arabis alpina TaxID=50452 RepID=A0A087G2X0_ARAAL|nr:hypothetical protein AALP_AAs51720U000700 [Arabis alpina]